MMFKKNKGFDVNQNLFVFLPFDRITCIRFNGYALRFYYEPPLIETFDK